MGDNLGLSSDTNWKSGDSSNRSLLQKPPKSALHHCVQWIASVPNNSLLSKSLLVLKSINKMRLLSLQC